MATKRGYINFVQQLIASYSSGKAFFVINSHKKSILIAGMFKKLGIVRGIKITDFKETERSVFKIAKKKKSSHMIIWLQYNERNPAAIVDSVSPISFNARPQSARHSAPFHRIVLTRRQSRINFSSKCTLKGIFIHYKPRVNVISILETQAGLITSAEAIQRKQAGYIICTIYILRWVTRHRLNRYVTDFRQIELTKELVR